MLNYHIHIHLRHSVYHIHIIFILGTLGIFIFISYSYHIHLKHSVYLDALRMATSGKLSSVRHSMMKLKALARLDTVGYNVVILSPMGYWGNPGRPKYNSQTLHRWPGGILSPYPLLIRLILEPTSSVKCTFSGQPTRRKQEIHQKYHSFHFLKVCP
jgi:hypothetical protein